MTTLHCLLDATADLPPEYGDGLTSHLPMALQALSGLGASDGQLQHFAQTYAERFGARRSLPLLPAPLPDWTVLRGDFEAFPRLRAHFAHAVQQQGLPTVLEQALPALWPGLAAAALHGPIRLAHALAAGHAGETATALAYWAARWQPLDPGDASVPPLGFDAGAAALQASAGQWVSSTHLITLRMTEASVTPVYRSLAEAWQLGTEPLLQLSALAASTYAATGNFTVLHLVTGLHAVHSLLARVPAAPPPEVVLRRAFVAGWLAAGLPTQPKFPPPPLLNPGALRALACASQDDHQIKLIATCLALAKRHGDGPWLAAAQRAAG